MTNTYLITLICLADAALAGSITGTVAGKNGNPVPADLVIAQRVTPLARRDPPVARRTVISPNGSFNFPSLPFGTYLLCTSTPKTVWLDSCDWGQQGVTATISAEQPTAAAAISVQQGALVGIRVNDPGQNLALHEGRTPGGHVLLGVEADGRVFKQAFIASQDQSGRDYRILIPFDRPLRLSVGSGLFKLSDVSGRALPALGNTIPLMVPSISTSASQPGSPSATVVLSLTGIGK